MHDFDQNVITFVSAFKVAPMGLVAKCSTKVSSGLIAIVFLPYSISHIHTYRSDLDICSHTL